MKRSNLHLVAWTLVSALYFVCVLALLIQASHTSISYGWDSFSYAYAIDSEIVVDWHSSLFCWAHIFLKKTLALIGMKICGANLLIFTYVFSLFIICAALGFFEYILWKEDRIASYICLPFIFVDLFLLTRAHLVLDTYFAALNFIALLCFFKIIQRQYQRFHITLVFILLIIFLCMISFRKNAIFSVFICIFYIIPIFIQFSGKAAILRRLFVSCILTFLMYISGNTVISRILPTIHEYPTIPMLLSDISNVSALTGEPLTETHPIEEWRGTICRHVVNNHGIAGLHMQNCNQIIQSADYSKSYAESRELFYNSLCEEYTNYIRQRPQEIIVSRLVQLCQFYTGGNIPFLLRDYLEDKYPHLKEVGSLWTSEQNGHSEPLLLRIIPRLGGLICSILALCIGSIRHVFQHSAFSKTMYMAALIGVFYGISFIPFTPYPDLRYLMPTTLLGFIALPYLLYLNVKINYTQIHKGINEPQC